jgi:alpha-L-fucosidase
MGMNKIIIMLLFFCCPLFLMAQKDIPKPTKAQLAWHDMEFYLFMHFGPNTFTDLEWGHGNEKEEVFNPTNLDCEQWCRIAKAAGAKGIIITAKHHDGFCLWPSKYSTHTVRESKWKDGKGDVLKELSAACKKYDLKFGVYISPWDRNHPDYGTEKYNDVFVNMMKELFANYGPIWELWWDGANGEGPNGKKQVYDWHRFEKTVRELSPNTIVFSDIGPDIRWCGNENGIAGETNWNTLDTAGFTRGAGGPPQDTLNTGNINGKNWIPAECDVSIRPGWFYHKAEDDKVKTAEQLFNLYLKSVGRGANLLLNVPPDGRGLITKYDSAALVGFNGLRKESFKNNLIKNASVTVISGDSIKNRNLVNDNNSATFVEIADYKNEFINIHFKTATKINCVVLYEVIKDGQNVEKFYVQIRNKKQLESYMFSTVGRKRIISFPLIEADDIMIHFPGGKNKIKIAEVGVYLIDEKLIVK